MNLPFRAISLSHHRAPVGIRELIYLNESTVRALMIALQDLFNPSELLILSTCNRTEIYYASDNDFSHEIIIRLLHEKGISDTRTYLGYFDLLHESEVVIQHLFEVAMGLKSGIVGDIQIAYQVKSAYSISNDLGLAGPVLHRLLHTIFHAGKRVQTETAFRDGAASVSYAAVETAEEVHIAPEQANVLVIGLGEMGADVARNLKYSAFKQVTLMNRTVDKALQLSEETGFAVLPYESLTAAIHKFDVVFIALNTTSPLITHEILSSRALHHHLYLMDLSVPRGVEAKVEDIPGVLIFNIDEIQSKASLALQKRLEAVPRVKEIIQEEIAGFTDWSKELSISPTIHLLKDALEGLRKEELARHLRTLDEKEFRIVDEVTKSLMLKIMKLPVLQLKEACKRGDAENLVDLLHTLFNLEDSKTHKPVK